MKQSFEVGHVVKFHIKVFQNKNYVPHYDAYKGHQFIIRAIHTEDEGEPMEPHYELECLTGDVKMKGWVHEDEIQFVPVESCDYTAYDMIKHIGVIPMSIETKKGETPRPPTDAEIRRWLENKAVQINGLRPKPTDIIEFPVWELIFFPKGGRRTTVLGFPPPESKA